MTRLVCVCPRSLGRRREGCCRPDRSSTSGGHSFKLNDANLLYSNWRHCDLHWLLLGREKKRESDSENSCAVLAPTSVADLPVKCQPSICQFNGNFDLSNCSLAVGKSNQINWFKSALALLTVSGGVKHCCNFQHLEINNQTNVRPAKVKRRQSTTEKLKKNRINKLTEIKSKWAPIELHFWLPARIWQVSPFI